MKTRYKIFVGLMTVASLPFLATGLGLEIIAVQKAFAGEGLSVLSYMLLGMSLFAVGISVPVSAYRSSWKGSRLDDLRDAHPHSPWLWRDEWRQQILCCGSEFPVGPIMVAVLWNIVVIGLTMLLYRQWLAEQGPMKWVITTLPAVGLVLAGYAWSEFSQWHRFRETRFVLGSLPVPAGDLVEGIAYTSIPAECNPASGFKVSLSCINEKVRLDRMARSTRTYLLWRDERWFLGVNSLDDPSRIVIPLFFRLPADSAETSLQSNDRVTWRLQIEGKTELGEYRSRFVLPVFLNGNSDDRVIDWADNRTQHPIRYMPRPVDSGPETVGTGIEIESDYSGETVIRLGKARHLALTALVALVTTIWWGMMAFMYVRNTPAIFVAPCLVGGLLALYGSVVMATFESTIVVGRGKLAFRRGPFGRGKTHRASVVDIDSIRVSTGSRTGRAYLHNIVMTDTSGETHLLADLINDKSIADWLVFRIQSVLNGMNSPFADQTARPVRRDRNARRQLTHLSERINQRVSVLPPSGT